MTCWWGALLQWSDGERDKSLDIGKYFHGFVTFAFEDLFFFGVSFTKVADQRFGARGLLSARMNLSIQKHVGQLESDTRVLAAIYLCM